MPAGPLDNLKAAFGDAVRQMRNELHLSQEELADRAGLHRTYVSDVERGTRNPSLESIEKIAGALTLSVSGLFQRITCEEAVSQPLEILLIEDDQRDVEMTRRAFRKARISNRLHVARDGAEAVDFLFSSGAFEHRRGQPLPGLILLDLNLPKLSGLEVLQRIKADPETRAIPVVVLTVSSSEADIAECRRHGISSYLVKPVGFQNFSEVTPHLRMDWALLKAEEGVGYEHQTA